MQGRTAWIWRGQGSGPNDYLCSREPDLQKGPLGISDVLSHRPEKAPYCPFQIARPNLWIQGVPKRQNSTGKSCLEIKIKYTLIFLRAVLIFLRGKLFWNFLRNTVDERTFHPLLKLKGRARSCILTVSANFKMGPGKKSYYLTLRETKVVNVLNINCTYETNLKSTCKLKIKLPSKKLKAWTENTTYVGNARVSEVDAKGQMSSQLLLPDLWQLHKNDSLNVQLFLTFWKMLLFYDLSYGEWKNNNQTQEKPYRFLLGKTRGQGLSQF